MKPQRNANRKKNQEKEESWCHYTYSLFFQQRSQKTTMEKEKSLQKVVLG